MDKVSGELRVTSDGFRARIVTHRSSLVTGNYRHVSFSPTVRLNTSRPGSESGSTQK